MDEQRFGFTIGDDLDSARDDRALQSVLLRVALEGYSRWNDTLSVRFNGQTLRGEFEGQTLLYTNPPVRQGENELIIAVRNHSPSRRDPIRIEGIELLIDYAE